MLLPVVGATLPVALPMVWLVIEETLDIVEVSVAVWVLAVTPKEAALAADDRPPTNLVCRPTEMKTTASASTTPRPTLARNRPFCMLKRLMGHPVVSSSHQNGFLRQTRQVSYLLRKRARTGRARERGGCLAKASDSSQGSAGQKRGLCLSNPQTLPILSVFREW